MFCEYIHAALPKATYEIIEDEEPLYGEIPELRGVWAIEKALEECRENLKGAIEGWIALRLRLGLAIPPINQPSYYLILASGSINVARWILRASYYNLQGVIERL